MRRIFITILATVSVASVTRATIHTAATASRVDVLAKIALCVPGDTVIVPAGTASWAGDVSITGITLQGAGQSGAGTVITAGMVTLTKHASAYTKMIGFRFTANDQHFLINGNLGDKAYVVGDCYFFNNAATMGLIATNGGLFYLCNFEASPAHNADVFRITPGMGGLAAAAWAGTPTMGAADTTGEINNYFENCTWIGFTEVCFDNDDGARTVVRKCTMTDSGFTCHGGGSGTSENDTSTYGSRYLEVYDCTFIRVSNAIALNKWVWWRGSGGVFVDNVVDKAESPDGSSYPGKPELRLTVGCLGGAYPRGYQVGQTVQTPENPPSKPIYIFGNSGPGVTSGQFIALGGNPNPPNDCPTPGAFIQAGRDYVTTNTWGWSKYPWPHPLRSATPSTPASGSVGTVRATTFKTGQ